MNRDTTLTQQGRSGRLEKNGAELATEPGKMAYLQTEPVGGTYAGFNPFPEATYWRMSAPGGCSVKADGRLGIARVVVRPKEARLWVDHAYKKGQEGRDEMATALLVFGLPRAPTADLNGVRLEAIKTVPIGGEVAYVVPLTELTPAMRDALPARLTRAESELEAGAAGPDASGAR
jgi:hypothetical protein